MAKEVRIGFLRQDLKMDMHKTIVQIARSAFEEVEKINVRIEEINAEFAVRTDYESDGYGQLISEISDLSERFGMLGGDSLDADVELVLKGLGFVPEVFDQPLSTFSGVGECGRNWLDYSYRNQNYCCLMNPPTT